MDKLRIGIIGLGVIGKQHADYLLAGKVSRCELTAVCSSTPEKLGSYATRGLKIFSDSDSMFRSGTIDAVLVATPHYQHPALGIAALAAGLHLIVEKPVAAHKADAEKLVREHRKHPQLRFTAMFQMRAEPRFQKMRGLIRDGVLGKIVRVNWLNTDWFRTETYYASGGWRATWRGEGGGVLLNQALHNLDMLGWLCGAPARVRAFCQFGRFHDIEVEDDVTAYLEWAGGATGSFITSTGEAPGSNRLEIAGTQGKLVLEHNRLTLVRNTVDMAEFSRTATQPFAKPETMAEEIPFATADLPHAGLMQNFVNAILDGEPLLAPGAEGILSVELANAMVYSSLTGQTVELPLDGAAWERKLNELIAGSKVGRTAAAAEGSRPAKNGTQMAFKDHPEQSQGVALLQRSLARGRLGHAYLFTGGRLEELEVLARTLAKTLNCHNPVRSAGRAEDCCDECLSCRKIEGDTHADVFWVRPESKLRQIKIGQITRRPTSPPRVLLDVVTLKPTEGEFKVCILSAADRMNEDAANSLLKTLEEPPPQSVLILLSAEPQRLLDTVVSRCLRLNFSGGGPLELDAAQMDWLRGFSDVAATEQKSLLARYRLLDSLVQKLGELKAQVEELLGAKSPLEKYEDIESGLREKWEGELAAAVESEYRRRRGELLAALQWWLRDVWLRTLSAGGELLQLPELAGTAAVARRISPAQALENLRVLEQTRRLLHTNVQEALALEVGLLNLHL